MTYGRLKNRSIVALALVGLAAGAFPSQPLRSATQVTLTPLPNVTGQSPIGIDWFPATDQLIISDHYDGDAFIRATSPSSTRRPAR